MNGGLGLGLGLKLGPTHREGGGAWVAPEASLRTLYAASESLDTPHSLGVMASPPTITVSGGTAGAPAAPYTALTQAQRYSLGSTAFHYAGGGDFLYSSLYRRFPAATRVSGGAVDTTQDAGAWRVTVDADAQSVAFRVLALGFSVSYRFIVDGQYVSVAGTADINGGRNYITLDFGSKTLRRITLEGSAALAFDGVHVAVGDTLAAPTDLDPRIALFLGDSFTLGTGTTNGRWGDGYGMIAGEHLGFKNIWLSGQGGTGYVNEGTNQYKLAGRITADINRAKAIGTVAKVFIAMGLNDFTLSGIQAEAASCFNTLRSLLPAASVTVVQPWDVNAPSAPNSDRAAVVTAINAAASGRGGFHVIDPLAVEYTKFDSTHPDDAGHETLGIWLAEAERTALGV